MTSGLLGRPLRPPGYGGSVPFDIAAELGAAMRSKLGFAPHPVQAEILASTARNQVLAAGRRFGKSQVGGHKLVPAAFTAFGEKAKLEAAGQRREYWIVGPEYSDAEKEFRVVYNALRRLGVDFDRPGTYNNPQSGDMRISLWEGAFQVHAKSAKYPETLVGEGLSGLVLSEAAKLKEITWTKYLRPTLADFRGWSFMGSTPEGRNWFYRAWESGQDPLRPDWASWRAPAWSNPYVYRDMRAQGRDADLAVRILQGLIRSRSLPERLPVDSGLRIWMSDAQWESVQERTWEKVGLALGLDPEIVALALDLSEETFNQEEAALFNEYVGRVFKDWDEDIHVGDFDFEPDWKTYAAIDYGFTNPFVWLLIQVDPFGERIRVIDEYYERGRTNGEAFREIRDRGLAPGGLLEFYPDPAEPDRTAEGQSILNVRAAGSTGGLLEARIEWIRRKLKGVPAVDHLGVGHPDWSPQLQVHRRCKHMIREMGAYRYPRTAEEAAARDKEAPESPLKKDDHTPEALGRFMIGHYGSPWKDVAAPSRQRRAKIGRRAKR
jgi:hypothetical protein